jgi:hypothetical protein
MIADDWSHEQSDNAPYADERNFYKLEKLTRDDAGVRNARPHSSDRGT